jgi:hypothetical protein
LGNPIPVDSTRITTRFAGELKGELCAMSGTGQTRFAALFGGRADPFVRLAPCPAMAADEKQSGSNLSDQNNMVEPTAAMCIWTAASKRRHLFRALHENSPGSQWI